MKIRINETSEIKELSIIGLNGIEWTGDLLSRDDALIFNSETEEYEMNKNAYEWWKEYIDNFNVDEKAIEELAEELNIEVDDINLRLQLEMNCDMEDEHMVKQNILNEIREEYME